MWFNSSSSTLKGYGTAAGIPAATWASGGALNTAREQIGVELKQQALVLEVATPAEQHIQNLIMVLLGQKLMI